MAPPAPSVVVTETETVVGAVPAVTEALAVISVALTHVTPVKVTAGLLDVTAKVVSTGKFVPVRITGNPLAPAPSVSEVGFAATPSPVNVMLVADIVK